MDLMERWLGPPFRISITSLSGDEYPLLVRRRAFISWVHAEFVAVFFNDSDDAPEINFIMDGQLLDGTRTLEDYNITETSECPHLHVVFCPSLFRPGPIYEWED